MIKNLVLQRKVPLVKVPNLSVSSSKYKYYLSLNLLKMKFLNLNYFLFFILILSGSCKVNQSKIENSGKTTPNSLGATHSPSPASPVHFESKIYRAERTKVFQLIHTKLEVSFDWEKQYLHGTATLDLKPYFYPKDSLVLDAKGFDIHQISLIENKQTKPLKYSYDNNHIYIYLGKEFTRNDLVKIEIKYTAKPNERVLAGSNAIKSDKGLYFINADGLDPEKPKQIWTQGETESNSAWFPTIDSPNQKTTQEIYITVSDNFKTLSNGKLIYSQKNKDNTRTDFWKLDKPHAPYLFMMAIGEYAVVEDSWNGIDVDYYVEPEFEKYAKDIFGNTPEMLTFFSNILNYKYPWPKYSQAIVRDYVSGAMENTSASIFMEAVQVDDRALEDENWDGIIAHELFHQWFGNVVTTESWSNLPLNESFANYGEYLWFEHKYGKEEADYQALKELEQYLAEAESKKVDLIRYYYEDKEDMFDSHSYAKGGLILHMLRKLVGDEAFFKSLEYYLRTNEYSAVEIHHLRLAFEKITGQDLNWFFNQWFLASGHPQLKVDHQYSNGKLKLFVHQIQDPQTTPIYKLPVVLDVWVKGKNHRFPVTINKMFETFEFSIEGQPDLVLFDGEQQILAEIDHSKSFEELVFQFKNSDKFKARYEALEELENYEEDHNLLEVYLSGLKDSSWVIRQTSLNNLEAYFEEHFEKIEPEVVRLAKHDPKSLVRSDAIAILAGLDAETYIDLFKKGIDEKSYAVVGASLFGYMMTDSPDKFEVVKRFEDYNSSHVYLPIASIYAEAGNIEKYDWFTKKIKSGTPTDLYYMLQLFGELLINGNSELKRSGSKLLYDHAINNKTYFVRLAAYQGLTLIGDFENVAELQKEIREKEKDERLKNIYSSFE
jgi:aminopeptidase N